MVSNCGLTLNYHAVAPKKYKRSVVRSFVYRVYNSCSTWQNFDLGLEKAVEILKDNQYPPEFYDPIINETLEHIITKRKKAEKPCFNEEVTGKGLFYIQYRGPETSKYVTHLIKSGALIIPIYTTRKLRNLA